MTEQQMKDAMNRTHIPAGALATYAPPLGTVLLDYADKVWQDLVSAVDIVIDFLYTEGEEIEIPGGTKQIDGSAFEEKEPEYTIDPKYADLVVMEEELRANYLESSSYAILFETLPGGSSENVYYEPTRYIYDMTQEYPQVLAEFGNSPEMRTGYTYANGQRESGGKDTLSYYLYDGRTSVSALLSGGSVAASYSYDPFGQVLEGAPAQDRIFGFNGEEYTPQTGMIYLRARHYSPADGRFTTQDTYLGSLIDTVSQNRYAYCGNDPVNFIDPSGFASTSSSTSSSKSSSGSSTKSSGSDVYSVGKVSNSTKGLSHHPDKPAPVSHVKVGSTSLPGGDYVSITVKESVSDGKGGFTAITHEYIVSRYVYENNPRVKAIVNSTGLEFSKDIRKELENASILHWSTTSNQKYYESYWTNNEQYFNGKWWFDDEKVKLSSIMLLAETQAKGYVSLNEMSNNKNVYESNNKLYTIQWLVDAERTNVFDEQTLARLENALEPMGVSFTHHKTKGYYLTSDGIKILIDINERSDKEAKKRWDNGGREITAGMIIIVGAAIVSAVEKWEPGGQNTSASKTEGKTDLELKNGSKISVDDALDAASNFLGKGYKDMGNGRFVSADGTRQVRMGDSDILGYHAGGPHMNFETLAPNPLKPGKMMIVDNMHIYISE